VRAGLTAKGLTSSAPPSSKGLSYRDLPAMPLSPHRSMLSSSLARSLPSSAPDLTGCSTRRSSSPNRPQRVEKQDGLEAVGGTGAASSSIASRTGSGDGKKFSGLRVDLSPTPAVSFYLSFSLPSNASSAAATNGGPLVLPPQPRRLDSDGRQPTCAHTAVAKETFPFFEN
jgi:hypothetical protein